MVDLWAHGAGLVGGAGRVLAIASARNGAPFAWEKAQGHREVPWPAGTLSVSASLSGKFFPIAPLDFQSIGGGGRVEIFSEFFFLVIFGGGEGVEGGR